MNDLRKIALELKQMRDAEHVANVESETIYKEHPGVGSYSFPDKLLQQRFFALCSQVNTYANQLHGLEKRLLAATIAYFTVEEPDRLLYYQTFVHSPMTIRISDPEIAKTLLLRGWVEFANDGISFRQTTAGIQLLHELIGHSE